MPKSSLPPPPTLGELRALPVVLNLDQTRRALGLSDSQTRERLANGTFPVSTMEPRKPGLTLRFRLADVLAALGFGPADILRELGPAPSPSSPAGDRERRDAA